MDETLQERLVNWGYVICDTGLRAYVSAGAAPGHLPYPRESDLKRRVGSGSDGSLASRGVAGSDASRRGVGVISPTWWWRSQSTGSSC